MAVQRWDKPIRLVTDSMSGGGQVHQSFGGGPPGSMPVDGVPQDWEVEPLADVMAPSQESPGTDRNLLDPTGARREPGNAPFGPAGGFAQADTEDSNATKWKKTTSSSS